MRKFDIQRIELEPGGSKAWWLNDKEYTEKKYNKLMLGANNES